MKILITGVTSGIGRELAKRIQKEYWDRAELWGISRSVGGRYWPSWKWKFDDGITVTRADVAMRYTLNPARNQIMEEWGCLDAIIHAAGVQGEIEPMTWSQESSWRETVDVNLLGTFNVLQAFRPLLGKRGRSKVIAFSGGGAACARPNFSAYAASKTGVVRLVETVAQEWARDGILADVNALAPGAMLSSMTRAIAEAGPQVAGEREYAHAIDLVRNGTDPEVLERCWQMVDFLLSEDSDGISGRFLSAQWDDPHRIKSDIQANPEAYLLRRIVPAPQEVTLGT